VALGALLGLILARAVLYRLLGPPADWTANLDLGAVTLFFRSDRFWLMLLFSLLSFGRTLVVVYFWLLMLVVVNKSTSPNSIGVVLRRQLGPVAAYTAVVQLALPLQRGMVFNRCWLIPGSRNPFPPTADSCSRGCWWDLARSLV
jgi:hypothetical protein